MKKSCIWALFFSLILIGPAYAEQPEVYKNPTVGFEITKPAGWHFMTADQNLENLKKMKLNDAEFHQQMVKYANSPMVAMTKYPEPHDNINPSLKVNIRPLGQLKGKAATEILAMILPAMQKNFKDCKIVQPPMEAVISGMSSGYARMEYSMEAPDGETYEISSELWLVIRGDYLFIMGAGTRQDQENGSREEIARIVESIKIEP